MRTSFRDRIIYFSKTTVAGGRGTGVSAFLVHDWLRGCEGKWLIILDNVDDADFLVNVQSVIQSQSDDFGRQTLRPLRDYLPQSQNGSILITTRSQESALKLSEWNDLIPVDPMDVSNAVELLDKRLELTGQRNDNRSRDGTSWPVYVNNLTSVVSLDKGEKRHHV